jgi:hypothetical protein
MNKLTPEQLQAKMHREQLKKQEQDIEELELKARYWEAQWKIRHFTLESEKLQPEYDRFIAEQRVQQEEAIKRFQEEIEKANKATADQKVVNENKEFLDSIVPQEVNPLAAV